MLYHQIHPLKLVADFATSFCSTWLLWDARWLEAAFVAFVPSVIASIVLVAFVPLERYRQSVLGRYVGSYMNQKIVAARSAGQLLAWGGAIVHMPWVIPLGYFVILLAWLNGLWQPAPHEQSSTAAVR